MNQRPPKAVSVIEIAIYLCSLPMLIILGFSRGACFRGCGDELTGLFVLIVVSHWAISALLSRGNIIYARWLILATGTFPLLGIVTYMLYHAAYNVASLQFLALYMFVFGGLVPVYLFFSHKVKIYASTNRT